MERVAAETCYSQRFPSGAALTNSGSACSRLNTSPFTSGSGLARPPVSHCETPRARKTVGVHVLDAGVSSDQHAQHAVSGPDSGAGFPTASDRVRGRPIPPSFRIPWTRPGRRPSRSSPGLTAENARSTCRRTSTRNPILLLHIRQERIRQYRTWTLMSAHGCL